jgi:hypothetical protein
MEGFLTGKPYYCGLEISVRQVQLLNRNRVVNFAAVRHAVTTSPRRSAIKHALALGISDQSVRRILHTDLKFQPYKMIVVQELRDRDWLNRQASCEAILENVPADADVLSSYAAEFSVLGCRQSSTTP